MELLIDIDSAVFKAGCSNETREWLVTYNDNVIHSTPFKRDATKWVEDVHEAEGIECSMEMVKRAGPLSHSLANCRTIVEKILNAYPSYDYTLYLGGKGNFRYDIYPEYKGNRDPASRPIHEKEIREYIIRNYRTEVVDGEEADDRVSYLGCLNDSSVIVSIDKDLKNTPGTHYNYDKEEETYIDMEEANFNFATQLLTGDSGDNIPGLKGIGKGLAAKILPHPIDNWEEVVYTEYQLKGHGYDYFLMNGRLLWMRREPEEMWVPTRIKDRA